MILTVDIGNTNIVYGIFDGDKVVLESRMDTDKNRMADQYAVTLSQLFSLYHLKIGQIDGAVISSVRRGLTFLSTIPPPWAQIWRAAAQRQGNYIRCPA